MSAERLPFIRIRSRLTTIIRYSGNHDDIHRALTRDISVDGLCLLTETPLKMRELIGVELKLPDRETPISFTGEVLWHQKLGDTSQGEESNIENGIRFVTITRKDRQLLMQWVALHALHPDLGDR